MNPSHLETALSGQGYNASLYPAHPHHIHIHIHMNYAPGTVLGATGSRRGTCSVPSAHITYPHQTHTHPPRRILKERRKTTCLPGKGQDVGGGAVGTQISTSFALGSEPKNQQ